MMLVLFLAALLSAVSSSDEQELQLQPQQGDCPTFWYSFNGRCFKYVATSMTWIDAERHCVAEGGNLVSIHSEEEENYVKFLIRNFDPAQGLTWIGLTDKHEDGAWLWSDGSKVTFTFWNKEEPNNFRGPEECVQTNWGNEKKWNDKACSAKFSFVCATRANCVHGSNLSDSTPA